MRMLGLGVWQVPNGPECVNAVRWAHDFHAVPLKVRAYAREAGATLGRVAPAHCCAEAPSGPCMPLIAAHGPSKPPGRFRCLAAARVTPAAVVAVGCRCRARGAFACSVPRWAC